MTISEDVQKVIDKSRRLAKKYILGISDADLVGYIEDAIISIPSSIATLEGGELVVTNSDTNYATYFIALHVAKKVILGSDIEDSQRITMGTLTVSKGRRGEKENLVRQLEDEIKKLSRQLRDYGAVIKFE